MRAARPTAGARRRAALLACVLLPVTVAARAPEGIPRDLARARAQRLREVRYRLSYAITPGADAVVGHEELRFVRRPAARAPGEWLDFREGTVTRLAVNGRNASPALQNGHLALPGALLAAGENVVEIDFTAPVAPAGKALTRFEDKDDGSEYVYTLFVPMDAEMAFPCFDQPDLKARFRLAVAVPAAWTVISNAPEEHAAAVAAGGAQRVFEFAETEPISTYLVAFAAGPFVAVHDAPGLPRLYARKSRAKQAEAEAPEVQRVAADGAAFLADYFARPFPFPKHDLVLVPGFPFGGMEHAGASFLREESVLFRTAPTHTDRVNRDLLVLHELTHQWFGDLVTMRWFDDLWLKEGFAQYMASVALDALKPHEDAWRRFYLAQKPAAYAIDATQGTTPIYQDITNLKDAKSAYGAIVYAKAPGVIKQLAFVVGADRFREGLRRYLREHAYGNAAWRDLVDVLERVSGRSLQAWARAWIRRRGMPQVDARWRCDEQGRVRVTLTQHDVLHEGGVWPLATLVRLGDGAASADARVELRRKAAELVGPPRGCPDYVFANARDEAYGRFLLDPVSRRAVVAHLGGVKDLFQRTLLWGSLWESVREAELDPREYVDLALRLLGDEDDEALAQRIIAHAITALHRYVDGAARAALVPRMEALAAARMVHAPSEDLRIAWFRALRAVAETATARGQLKDLLTGALRVPGVELRPLDRWQIVAALLALHDGDAEAMLAAEERRDPSGDGRKYAYVAAAARPRPETKRAYFEEYLHDAARPEDWVEQSLESFNWWNQAELTAAYLRPALHALPQVKRQRKIFFLLAWLRAFIGGQHSPAAQDEVHRFLATAALDEDLRRKVLEVVDELDRTVRIRRRYG